MEFVFGLKELIMICGFIFSFAGGWFGLKFYSKHNKEKNIETKTSLDEFKKFIYDEIKEIKDDLHKMLEKDEAERKYLPRTEHELTMKNIQLQLQTIVDKLDEMKG